MWKEIPFHDDTIMVARDGNNIWVDPKPICERLGLSWQGQHKKLVSADAEEGRAVITMMMMTGRDGKT